MRIGFSADHGGFTMNERMDADLRDVNCEVTDAKRKEGAIVIDGGNS